jgi:alkylation response protein AidB-like acyl-CoA dehydrogenase
METNTVLDNIRELSRQFARQRSDRQRRRELDAQDFDQVKQAGFFSLAIPAEYGGVWESVQRSTRPLCEVLRTLAQGDPSVALVCSMHPSVLALWLATPEAARPFKRAWQKQRRQVFQTVYEGAWWGTITSESGSGGDITKTKAVAHRDASAQGYLLSGQKHFGSGLGLMSFMITAAVPEGETEPDWFFMNLHNLPWDGSAGIKLLTEWDGHGMIATHSHSVMFERFPVERSAWPGKLLELADAFGGFDACVLSAVTTGIVETAIETARRQLRPLRKSLGAYRQVEWAKVETEGWLIQQAYEGMLRAVETKADARRDAVQGKMAIAELAESVLRRISRIMGGGTYTRRSPFGFWFEDVRALGFMRPPWGLAYDHLFSWSWDKGR